MATETTQQKRHLGQKGDEEANNSLMMEPSESGKEAQIRKT